jgi:aspartate aminotransferase-like enzyme
MKTYPIPMVPGPVKIPEKVMNAWSIDYGSGDLEAEFLSLYDQTEKKLQKLLATENKVTIHTGEGMLGLWGALKSCLKPGDRVLSIATGVFGYGIGDMAKSIGADVRLVSLPYDATISNWDVIEDAIKNFQPKMITVVHCETPSGTLNPLNELGRLKAKHNIPLIYADVVASVGGTPVLVDEWGIDLALGGSQKCLSAPPNMTFVSVSPVAWEIIEEVGYVGYDAIMPFRDAQETFYFPYTPYWHGMAALEAACDLILTEGLEACFGRHNRVASFCREKLKELGLFMLPAQGAVPSPTVTAVKIPSGISWEELDGRFRSKGLVVAGSYGPLAGKVFRMGHMGSQADMDLMTQALEAVQQSL